MSKKETKLKSDKSDKSNENKRENWQKLKEIVSILKRLCKRWYLLVWKFLAVVVIRMSEECLELQQEEAEVLTSIYDGDPAFVTVKAGEKYQYKLGDTEAETGMVTKY